MEADITLLMISSTLSTNDMTAIAGVYPTQISRKEGKTVWSHRIEDASVADIEANVIRLMTALKDDRDGIDNCEVWVTIATESEFAGFVLSSHCLAELARHRVDLVVSTYAQGKDLGSALPD